MLQRGHNRDGSNLVSTCCRFDLRKYDLFVMSWSRVRRVRRGCNSSELIMCGEGVHSTVLLPLVARWLETIDVCIWHMFVLCLLEVCGNVCCVAAVVEASGFLSHGVLNYVVCLCKGCDGCCVFSLYCGAWCCRCSCMGSMSVSSCICCMFVS